MRGEVGKETPKNEMDNKRILMTSHITLSAVPKLLKKFRNRFARKFLFTVSGIVEY